MCRFRLLTTVCWGLLLLAACAPRLRTGRFSLSPDALPQAAASRRAATTHPWNNWPDHLPDPAHPDHLPLRHLRVNIHILDNADGTAHRPADTARAFVRQLLDYANAELDTNVRNWRSPEGTAVLPKGFRYVLTPQPDRPGDDGIYLHRDDSLYFFVSMGRHQNNYDRNVIRKYGIGTDTILNIFLLVHHPDSMRSKTYRANGQGIALGTSLKMAGVLESREGPKSFDGLLNHEVGHILGLPHAWTEDGCPDTDNHPNKCWDWTPEPPCRDQATNNMMDYNAYQIALTPCQIGRIHANFARENNAVRRCLIPTWCTLHEDRTITIRDSVHWAGGRDLEGHVVVAAGGVLRLSGRVSMPPGGRITVAPGGRLALDGCRLHNACGKSWAGIFVQELAGVRGEVELLQTPELLDIGN